MRLFSLWLIVLLCALSLQAQTTARTALQDLLDLPSPPPVSPAEANAKKYPPEFYEKKTVPPDDAPIEDLLAYWATQNSVNNPLSYNIKPTDAVAQRIFEAIEAKPELTVDYLKILPAGQRTINLAKTAYNAESSDDEEENGEENYRHSQLKEWLKFNSDMFTPALLTKAQEVKDDKEYVTNQEELLALGKVDWEAARPIVERLDSDAAQPVSSTLAKWVLYQHAIDNKDSSDADKYREELKRVVEDKSASAGKRDLAMDALMQNEDWDGRDDWYLTLLDDETLFELKINNSVYTGLTTLIRRSPPDKWIPKMIELVGSQNQTVHRAAVRNLAELLDENRKDVIIALLPWLENPKWADEVQGERRKLLQAVIITDVPESVPGLIQVMMSEDSDFRFTAAQALAKYKSPQAIPSLNFALSKEKNEVYRTTIITALINCGGVPDDEQMLSLEVYATAISTPEGLEKMQDYTSYDSENPLPIQMGIGKALSEQTEPDDGLVTLALARVKVLRRTKPAVAVVLSDIMQKWQGRAIFLEMIRQISDGTANADLLLSAIARRKMLREKLPTDASLISGKSGLPRGIGATIFEDQNQALSILSQTDADAQIAMLAGARLIRLNLPVRQVSPLLKSADKLLALAAERYLESEDSAEARTLVLAQHTGEAKILGARNAFIPNEKKSFNAALLSELFESVNGYYLGEEDYSSIKKQEEKLRAETKNNPDLKTVFALLPDGASGQRIVRVYKDKITFTSYEDEARYRERNLTAKEYEDFFRLLINSKVDALSGVGGPCQEECSSSEFVMFSRDGGRRIFYSVYGDSPAPLDAVEKILNEFGEGESNLHYLLSDKIKGLEVLLADDKFTAKAIWKNAGDFRVLVEDKAREKEISAELDEKDKIENSVEIDDEDYDRKQQLAAAQYQRREEVKYEHYAWRKIENGKLGGTVAPPPDANYSPARIDGINSNTYVEGGEYNSDINRTRVGNTDFFAGYMSEQGLWKLPKGQDPILIKAGGYLRPIASSDGKWIVVAKSDEDYRKPGSVVRLNLQTGKEYKINLPGADKFYPVAAAVPQNKILLYRAKEEYTKTTNNLSPAVPEYYLLDAATGATQIVKGEFHPLEERGYRPLQPTGNAGEFWAAIYDEKTNATQIGRYDAKTFSFTSLLQIPDINLTSQDILVEEKEAKVYFVYQGHLLALPLTK